MKRTYTVMTAKRAGYPHRKYGYVIKIDPPIETVSHGHDYEGWGYQPHLNGPKVHKQHFQGWYKNKDRAQVVAAELNK